MAFYILIVDYIIYFIYYLKSKDLIKRKNINYNLRAVFIITSLILFFILRTIYYRIYSFFTENENDDDDEENINPDNETIYFEEKFDSYIEAFNSYNL